MRKLLLLFLIPVLCNSQTEKLQPVGTVATYVISCPCKLFKYYENGEMFYFCKDRKHNIDYTVKEFKHTDGLGILLNSVQKNLFRKKDTSMNNKKEELLKNYLSNNPNGVIIDFMNEKAVVIDEKTEKRIFFSDVDFLASYEISISSETSDSLKSFFNKSINSLLVKRKNLKTIF